MTPEEFEALKSLEDRRVRIKFSDGQQVVAKLVSATVDMDRSTHLIYDEIESSALPHLLDGKGAFHSPGEYVLSVVSTDGPDA